jgi:XTP/dITP diphosphohydrolase
MSKLCLASYNQGKIKEFKALLNNLNFELLTPVELDLNLDVPEVGSTYAENAAIKAKAFAQRTGMLTLADDSGLEVEVLGNAPGLFSARFDPKPGASDADRRKYLLEQLKIFPQPWKARFHCSVAVAEPGETFILRMGIVKERLKSLRGENMGLDMIRYFLSRRWERRWQN